MVPEHASMNKRSFTIIECVISLLILTILLTGGIAFYFYSHEGLRWSTNKRIALEIANSKLEEIKNDASYLVNHPPGADNLCEKITNIPVGNFTSVSNTLEVYAYNIPAVSYKQLEVRVTWPQPGKTGQDTISLTTYITP